MTWNVYSVWHLPWNDYFRILIVEINGSTKLYQMLWNPTTTRKDIVINTVHTINLVERYIARDAVLWR
jgi:hypothetical protein